MELIERFLKYVGFDTQSSEEGEGCPSTDKQMVFARYLENELKAIGLEEVSLDEHGYLYATLPANTEREVPTIGFIAHIDTSPDYSGKDVKPRIVEQYDGGDIVLCAEEGIVTSPKQFPELSDHVGEDLIVTDGHTLLGADDKAGIAEIIQAMVYLREHPEIKHGRIRVGFNPDEEIVKTVKAGLKAKDGYCPCRVGKDPDYKCMCKEFKEQIADPNFEGFCHCMLYYKSLQD